jgi:uncharacterized protein (DUF1330 family)
MKGYWIVKANTVNAEKQKDYASLASKAVEKFGGKYLVRGGQSLDKEGSIFERNVVVEFDTYEIAKQAYESEEYQYAKKILGDEKDRIFAIVEGT